MFRSSSKNSVELRSTICSLEHCLVFRHISGDIKSRVECIDVNERTFKWSEFATRIAGLMRVEKDDETKTFKTTPHGWKSLRANGARLATKFGRVPALSYLRGSVGAEQGEATPAKVGTECRQL